MKMRRNIVSESQSPMNYTILVIDDNHEIADNICSILQLARYNVLYAENGKSGVDIAKKKSPDLILCDILMPELDGYGVAHILQQDTETANIPFIFLTAKADKEDFRIGMDMGADDYITKPFDSARLLHIVEMRLKKNQTLRSLTESESEGILSSESKGLAEVKKLLQNRSVRTFKKKEMLFMEGQSPNDLYYIEAGQVKTYKLNYDGKELITGIHKAGDFIGFVPLLEDKPYNETAEILDEARILIIPKSDFLSVIYSSKNIAGKFIKILAKDLDEAESRLLDIAYKSVRQRVATVLLKLNEELSKRGVDSISMGRKDISNMVGTATESLNRTLADFKDEGLVEIASDGLRILNKEKMEKLLR